MKRVRSSCLCGVRLRDIGNADAAWDNAPALRQINRTGRSNPSSRTWTRTSSPRDNSLSTAMAGNNATPLPAATNRLMASIVGISTGIRSVTRRRRKVSTTLAR
jgi:hypothetical protein